MKDFNRNNVTIKVPELYKDGCYLVIEDEHSKNTLAVTWDELLDVVSLVDEIKEFESQEMMKEGI